jgi:hypothetical protein
MSSRDNHEEHRKAVQAALERAGINPTEDELGTAPLLDGWEVVRDAFDYTILYGRVTGHPILKGPAIRTSPLLKLNLTAGWARTYSRFYRLGAPLSDAGSEVRRALLVAAAAKGYHEMQPDEATEGIRRNRDLILKFPHFFR